MRVLPVVFLLACGKPTTPAVTDSGTVPSAGSTTDTSPPRPDIEVPLTLDFGEVGVGCTKTLDLPVNSVGEYPLSVIDVELLDDADDVFAIRWEEWVIAVGSSEAVEVDFTPSSAGTFTGARIRIRSDDTDDALVSTELVGATAADPTTVEHFDQALPGPVDVLFVLDRGGDSEPIIDGLKGELVGALDSWVSAGLDFRAAAVNADSANAGFLGATPVVDAGTPAPGQTLVDNIGVAPVVDHAAFDTVQAALTDPLLSGSNANFLRNTAELLVVTWSAVDDESAIDESAFATFVDGIYGGPAATRMSTVSGNAGLLGLGCNYGGLIFGTPVDSAPRLADAASLTGGVHANICQMSAADALNTVVEDVTGLRGTFELTGTVLDSSSITVEVDGVTVPEDATSGWTYRTNPSRIEFAPPAYPAAGAGIDVSYTTPAPCN